MKLNLPQERRYMSSKEVRLHIESSLMLLTNATQMIKRQEGYLLRILIMTLLCNTSSSAWCCYRTFKGLKRIENHALQVKLPF